MVIAASETIMNTLSPPTVPAVTVTEVPGASSLPVSASTARVGAPLALTV
jgi:hypothetical protein